MSLIDWNTAGPIFFATCDHCGERVGGCDLLDHACPDSAEFWKRRYLIERRFGIRMQFLLGAALIAFTTCALLGWP